MRLLTCHWRDLGESHSTRFVSCLSRQGYLFLRKLSLCEDSCFWQRLLPTIVAGLLGLVFWSASDEFWWLPYNASVIKWTIQLEKSPQFALIPRSCLSDREHSRQGIGKSLERPRSTVAVSSVLGGAVQPLKLAAEQDFTANYTKCLTVPSSPYEIPCQFISSLSSIGHSRTQQPECFSAICQLLLVKFPSSPFPVLLDPDKIGSTCLIVSRVSLAPTSPNFLRLRAAERTPPNLSRLKGLSNVVYLQP